MCGQTGSPWPPARERPRAKPAVRVWPGAGLSKARGMRSRAAPGGRRHTLARTSGPVLSPEASPAQRTSPGPRLAARARAPARRSSPPRSSPSSPRCLLGEGGRRRRPVPQLQPWSLAPAARSSLARWLRGPKARELGRPRPGPCRHYESQLRPVRQDRVPHGEGELPGQGEPRRRGRAFAIPEPRRTLAENRAAGRGRLAPPIPGGWRWGPGTDPGGGPGEPRRGVHGRQAAALGGEWGVLRGVGREPQGRGARAEGCRPAPQEPGSARRLPLPLAAAPSAK